MQEFILVAVFLTLGLGAYWSMVIYPKQRAYTTKQKYVRSLGKGDEIVTYGGIIGKVIDIDAEMGVAYVEIADGLIIRFLIDALMHAYEPKSYLGKANDEIETGEVAAD